MLNQKETQPLPPIFNSNISVLEYARDHKNYIHSITKPKYNEILKFLNIWLNHYNIKLTKLIDFKLIDIEIITKDTKYNEDIFNLHFEHLYKYFNIENKNKIKFDNKKNIIIFLKKILNKINYTITKQNIDNKLLYTIKYKKK